MTDHTTAQPPSKSPCAKERTRWGVGVTRDPNVTYTVTAFASRKAYNERYHVVEQGMSKTESEWRHGQRGHWNLCNRSNR